jgi:peptidoglycan/xylan/chitin deacetylase (PgdA/CDA1 family)
MRSTPRPSLRACVVRIALCLVAMLALPTIARAHAETVVTFTFDDAVKTQNFAKQQLASHGMHGTFYVNSGTVNSNDYFMNWNEVDALAAAGNEIGGHSVNDQALTTLSPDEQRHAICDDAATLRNRGYTITSFAYSHGSGTKDPNVQSLLVECGYQLARKVGDLNGPLCLDCPFVSIPPAHPYAIYTNEYMDGPFTLDMLKAYVTATEEHGGGWVPLMLHDICVGCSDADVSPADFTAFLDWLQARQPSGTVVKTMRDAVAGSLPPAPTPVKPVDTTAPYTNTRCDGDTCLTDWVKRPVSLSLLGVDYGGSGVAATRYTTDGSVPTVKSPIVQAPITIGRPTLVRYRTWDGAGNAEPTKAMVLKVDTTPPLVGILWPSGSQALSTKQQVTILAGALDLTSGIKSVDFYVDGVKVGTDTAGLFTFVWKPVVGKHALTTVATDLAGNTATSTPVNVTVK